MLNARILLPIVVTCIAILLAYVSDLPIGSHWLSSFTTKTSNIETTLAIIKPDAIHRVSDIKKDIFNAGFTIQKEKVIQLSKETVKTFYIEHKGKPFYNELVTWMSRLSGKKKHFIICFQFVIMLHD